MSSIVNDIRTWIWVYRIIPLRSGTAIDALEIGLPDKGQTFKRLEALSFSALTCIGADGNLGTVLVHFAIARVILPRP